MVNKIDILCFGAHADDVEIGMAGTLVKYINQGYRAAICDLTKAELSSNGTVEQRMREARDAARIMGISERMNLQFPDRGLFVDDQKIKEIVTVIRKYKPKIIFAPFYEDRHPDHGQCSQLVKEALFNAGIKNYKIHSDLGTHRVSQFYYYMINGFHKPDFVIDISSEMATKVQILKAYQSQFTLKQGSVDTPLTSGYIETVEAREKMFGKEVGVTYAEGFKTTKPLLMSDLLG